MKQRLQFSSIFLLLLMVAHPAQSIILEDSFKKLEPGQNINGTIGVQLTARTNTECSVM